MKIAIMSDSHDRWDNLERAVELANHAKCENLLFAGDFISPPGIPILEKFDGDVKFVWGNNEAERVGFTRQFDASDNIELAGDIFEVEMGGVEVFMNHYPRISELAAKSGEFDLAIFGHTHKYLEEQIGKCLLVNPGEIQGYKTGEISFVIYDTESKKSEKVNII